MSSIDSLQSKIAEIVDECDAQARGIAGRSQLAFRRNAKPGTTIPDFTEFQGADETAREDIKAIEYDGYHRVCSEIDDFDKSIKAGWAQPASADDVATVQLTLSRKNISRDELAVLYERYKDNHQLAAAITDKAVQLEYYGIGGTEEYYSDDAKDAAARFIIGRYSSSMQTSPSMAATGVIQNLTHVNALGRPY